MKTIKLNYSLAIILIVLIFTSCKSVEFTFLEFFSTKDHKVVNKQGINNQNTNLLGDSYITINGIITDTINIPLNGVNILVLKDDQPFSAANSDAHGKYTIKIPKVNNNDSIHRDEYKVEVRANGYTKSERTLLVNSNNNIQLDFALKKLCSISGVVVMSDKTPVIGAVVLLKNNNVHLSSVYTGQDGSFQINQLEDGDYSIYVSHNKYAFPTQTTQLLNGIDRQNIEIIACSGEIRGVIKEQNAISTIQKKVITLQRMDITNYTLGQPFQITDTLENSGSYEFKGLDKGQYKIQVNAHGFGSLIVDTELKDSTMKKICDITLQPEGVISGKLIYYNPMDSVVFILIDDAHNSYITDNTELMNNGKYAIKGIASGDYTVALKWKSMIITKQAIHIKTGKATSGVDFILKEAAGSISGRIISKNNKEPIENAMIIASSKNSGNYAFSDKNGNYKLAGLSVGTYGIIVSSLKYETNSKSDLQLENDKVLENIDFNLSPN